jgi:hypothetical protein
MVRSNLQSFKSSIDGSNLKELFLSRIILAPDTGHSNCVHQASINARLAQETAKNQ